MLQKQYRLSAHIRFSSAKSFGNSFFLLKSTENSEKHNRFAFVVSKKIDKRATKRNKIKRIMRSLVEGKKDNGHVDMLLIARPAILHAKKEDIEEKLEEIFKKLT